MKKRHPHFFNAIIFLTSLILAMFISVNPAISEESAPSEAAAPAESNVLAAIVIPAGTRLMVTMDNTLDSRQHGAGHMFTVSLDSNLAVNGNVLCPKGTKLYGRLTQAKKSGRLAGQSEMTLQLTDIMINNIPHPIVSSGLKAVTEGTGKDTVRSTGGAAAVGGLLGGSKGAKRGAAIGLGASMLTSGNQINIPAGTLLEFSLQSDLTYNP